MNFDTNETRECIRGADIKYRYDARMVQTRTGTSFPRDPAHTDGLFDQAFVGHFDRDTTIQSIVEGKIDDAKTTLT